MKLIGSTTSPYVRKVRILLEGEDYEFETLKALSEEGAKRLNEIGPVSRIPILIDGSKTIIDSSLICEYLLEKKGESLEIDEKIDLKVIDELCDSGIILFQHKLWQCDENWQGTFCQRHLKRANDILEYLNGKVEDLSDFQKDWLYCVLDWFNFREVINWRTGNKKLENFYLLHSKSGLFKKLTIEVSN